MIVCWFSCGAASFCATKLILDKYGKENVRVVNNPVANEHIDNQRFLKDCEKFLGIKIEKAINVCYPDCNIEDVFEDNKFISNASGFAPCTFELKQIARVDWENNNKFDKDKDTIVLGYTSDEKRRIENFKKSKRNQGYHLECPLADLGWSKQKCFSFIESCGIKLPEIYTKYEFPNANCVGCVKSGSVWYWNLVRRNFPEVFKRRAEQSRRLGCRLGDLGKGNEPRHIFLDELSPSRKGRKSKECYIECGIFCEKGN